MKTLVEDRLAADHPLRRIRARTDEVLRSLDAEFDAVYSSVGRASIPPEQVLRAQLWRVLYSVRSDRQLEENLRFSLLCRWFVGLSLEDDAWDHSTFSKLRETAQLEALAQLFFEKHLVFLREAGLLSDEHLSVDGTLLGAWASAKSLVKRSDLDENGKPPPPPEGGRNSWVDFKGEKRSNETHVSATDPEARLASKGTGAKLSYELSVLSENRNNFAVAMTVLPPTGTSERDAAAILVQEEVNAGRRPETVGADRKYSDGDSLVLNLAALSVRSHFAVRDDRPNALARCFHDDTGYSVSIRCRMRIEEIFAYLKTICGLDKVKVRGLFRVWGESLLALSAYNLTHEAHLPRF
ncbi:MAG: IS5 family transposase [Thaumarchaeota archaeon]|nr:IS5 family transposase [Nitrososphaerota archaeon]